MFCQSIIEKAKCRKMKNESDNKNENDMQDGDVDEVFKMNDETLMKFTQQIGNNNSMKCENEMKDDGKDVRFGYRIRDEKLERLTQLCKMYIGTKNHHNFTRKIHPKEDRAKRYMYSIDVINSSLIVNEMEFLQFEIHGTSFLYHQIRKMVGLMVSLMRNMKYEIGEVVDECKFVIECEKLKEMVFGVNYKMAIPLAPS